MREGIKTEETIKLNNANLIIGLNGWGNAGEVSTFSVKYLADKLQAKTFGEIPPEPFHNYLIQRPMVSIEEGVIKAYIPPRNDLYYVRKKKINTNLVLLLGYEPHINWPKFVEAVLTVAEETGVQRIYTLGGYLADIPPETETPVSASTNNRKLISELKKARVELTSYHGPTSVYSALLWKAKEKKIDVISLWCAVPLYHNTRYPKAAYTILEKITQLTGLKLDLNDLKEKSDSFKATFEKEDMNQPQLRSLMENLRSGRPSKDPSYID